MLPRGVLPSANVDTRDLFDEALVQLPSATAKRLLIQSWSFRTQAKIVRWYSIASVVYTPHPPTRPRQSLAGDGIEVLEGTIITSW